MALPTVNITSTLLHFCVVPDDPSAVRPSYYIDAADYYFLSDLIDGIEAMLPTDPDTGDTPAWRIIGWDDPTLSEHFWISSSGMPDELALDFIQMDAREQAVVLAYAGAVGYIPDTLQDALDAFVGEFDTPEDFALYVLESHFSDTYDSLPDIIKYNINLTGLAYDLRHDFYENNGCWFIAN